MKKHGFPTRDHHQIPEQQVEEPNLSKQAKYSRSQTKLAKEYHEMAKSLNEKITYMEAKITDLEKELYDREKAFNLLKLREQGTQMDLKSLKE